MNTSSDGRDDASISEDAADARLVAVQGAPRDVTLDFGAVSIGRAPRNDVVLADDPVASGSHAEIIADEEGYAVVDRASTNGTWLNGARLVPYEEYPLDPGDVIVIGSAVYRFEDGGSEDSEESDQADAGGGEAGKPVGR